MRILVTGAGSGIGRAVCFRAAAAARARGDNDVKIAAVDVRPNEDMASLGEELGKQGVEVISLHEDMGTREGPARAVEQTISAFGGLDGLVSNAGINRPGAMLDYDVDDWDQLFAVNTRATWLLAKAAHSALKASRGAIVSVASMSGGQAHANLGAYGPSKAAAIMVAKVLAQEFAPDGVRVNTVSPGMVRTGMTSDVYSNPEVAAIRSELVPVGRVAEPEDIADAIVYLLSEEARYINGHDLVVDGGVTGNFLGRVPGLSSITRS